MRYSSFIRSSGPRHYWPMDEISGNAVDYGSHYYSDSSYNGTVTRAHSALLSREVDGNANRFAGGYVRTSNAVSGTMTLMVWVKTASAGIGNSGGYDGAGIVWSDVSGPNSDIIPMTIMANGKLGFGNGPSDTTELLLSTTTINTDVLHCLVVTRDATTGVKQIYVDGTLEATATHSTGAKSANGNMDIGGNTLDSRYTTGLLGHVAVWDRVLTGTEIAALNSEGRRARQLVGAVPPVDPAVSQALYCWYDTSQEAVLTDNATGTALADRSRNGRHTTASGGGGYYRTNRTPSGRPSIQWVGDGARMSTGASFNVGEGWTIFAVAKGDGLGSGQGTGTNAQGKRAKAFGLAASQVASVTGDHDLTSWPRWDNSAWPNLTTTWNVVELWSAASGVMGCLVNGVSGTFSSGESNVSNMDSTAAFGFGGIYMNVSAEYANTEMTEWMMWDRALSDVERAQVRAYLGTKHGIAQAAGTYQAAGAVIL